MLELPSKGILSTNQVRAAGLLYDEEPCKLGGKKMLVTKDGREIHMFINDGIAYLPVKFPTNEEMDS